MRGMLSLMAGLGEGVVATQTYQAEQERRDRQEARQSQMDALALERARREQEAYALDMADRQTMRSAAAPVVAIPDGSVPGMMPATGGIDEGAPAALADATPMVKVAGQRMAADQAAPALAAANAPEAVNSRYATALRGIDPVAAMGFQAKTRAAERDTLALATDRWNTDVSNALPGGPEALVKLASASHAFGEGGDATFSILYNADKTKFQTVRNLADGKTAAMPGIGILTNDEAGASKLADLMSRGITPQARIAHMQGVEKAALATKKDAREERLAESEIEYRTKMSDAALEKASAAEKNKSAYDRMPEGDKLKYAGALKTQEKLAETITKAKGDGTWDPVKMASHKMLADEFRDGQVRIQSLESSYAVGGKQMAGADPAGYSKPVAGGTPGKPAAGGTPSSIGAPGGVAGANPKDPAPMRNNNPGALMPGGRMAQYGTPAEGIKALDDNLRAYGKAGPQTLTQIISKWAPPKGDYGDNNDTGAYIAHVSRRSGLDPNKPLDLNDDFVRYMVGAAIMVHESGLGPVTKGGRSGPAPNVPAAAATGAAATARPAATMTAANAPGAPPPAAQTVKDVMAAGPAQMSPSDRAASNRAKYASERAAESSARATADAKSAAEDAAASQQFEADVKAGSMPAVEFVRKYSDRRGSLTKAQILVLDSMLARVR